MNWIDFAIIGICLIAIGIGYWKGFLKSVLSLVTYSLVFVGSFLLCKPTATWLMKITNWDTSLSNKISSWLTSLNPNFNTNLVGMDSASLSSHINETMNSKGFSGFFKFIFSSTSSKITPESITHKDVFTLNNYISQTLTILAFIVGCFIVFVILLFIIKWFLHYITDLLTDKSIIFRKTDKTLGCVFGLIRGLVWIFAFIGVIALFRNLPIMNGINNAINTSLIGKPLSNICYTIVDKYFNLKSMIRLISMVV